MRHVTRREWLLAVAPIAAWSTRVVRAAQLPTSFFDQTRVCDPYAKPTPARPAGAHAPASFPPRTSLTGPGVSGTRFVLAGQAVGLKCGPLKGARLEFWHADQNGAFPPRGASFAGYQLTDAQGHYRLETIVPGPEADGARIVHARVKPTSGAPLTTMLFLGNDARAKRAEGFADALALTVKDGKDGQGASFDFILDM